MKPTDRRRLRRGLSVANVRTAVAMVRVFVQPVEALWRYIDTLHGDYPWTARVRTPTGEVDLELPHPHDLRTVNEVFCRHDYGTDAPRVVVDIGANIGISAAYFLTRRPDAVVHAFEPVAANLAVLRRNTARFGGRLRLEERAVSPEGGPVRFVVEPVGRYSGLAGYWEHEIDGDEVTLDSLPVADALDAVLGESGRIDLLKVDTEGSELALVRAVRPDQWRRIGAVRYEHGGRVEQHPPPDVAPGWVPASAVASRGMPPWLRAVFRGPNGLYDRGWGRLLGTRILRLTHTGRRSGRVFHTVLEVVDHDPRTGAVTVVSGFGRGADWYLNVLAGGPVAVDLGRGPRLADHEVLAVDEAEQVLAGYERRHRVAALVLRPALSAMTGWTYRGTAEDRRRLVGQLPMVRFTPAAEHGGASPAA